MMETGVFGQLMISHLLLGAAVIAVLKLALSRWRNESAAVRHGCWALALGVLMTMPLLMLWPSDAPAPSASSTTMERQVTTLPQAGTGSQTGDIGVALKRPAAGTSTPARAMDLDPWLAAGWLMSALLQVVLLAKALRYVRRLRRRVRWAPTQLTDSANRLAHQMGLRRPVPVRLSDEIGSPQTVGTLSPLIVLPAGWSEQAATPMVGHALAHELAHIKRADHWWVWLQFGARILFGFNPAVWYAISQMNAEREAACDDWAVALGTSPRSYASSLLAVAASLLPGRPPELAIPCLRSKNHLRRRISHMLDAKKSHTTLRVGRLTLVAAAIAFAGAALAAPQWVSVGVSAREAIAATAASTLDQSRSPRSQDGLLYAAWQGDLQSIQDLLAAGADPDQVTPGRDPRTPLIAAARREHWDAMLALLDGGATVDFHHRQDESALIAASGRAPDEIIVELLARGAEAEDQVSGDGTPLIAAARHGNTSAAELLLAAGADPDTWSHGDESAMFHAVVGGHTAIVQMLLDAGADPSVSWRGDGTPLMLAIRHGHSDIAEILMAAGASVDKAVRGDGTALIDAARRNDVSMTEALLASGAEVNQAVRGDGNALTNAARRGHLEVATLLLEAGADVNAHVRGDDTPLINAVWSNDAELVALLLARGADPMLEGDYDRKLGTTRTPLNQAHPGSRIAALLSDAVN